MMRMIRHVAATLAVAAWLALTPNSAIVAAHQTTVVAVGLVLFPTEAAAQKHCPSDEVVWLNTASGVYHHKGQRWYGRTRHGAYVCRKEADAAGDRDTRNGQ